jgi:hypothetical protein
LATEAFEAGALAGAFLGAAFADAPAGVLEGEVAEGA